MKNEKSFLKAQLEFYYPPFSINHLSLFFTLLYFSAEKSKKVLYYYS
jgi:hypothetical protein